MENEAMEKWPPIIFFSIVGGLAIFFVYYLVVNTPMSNASDVYMNTYLAEVETIPAEADVIILELDREIRIREKHFVYRGVQDRHIRIEVIVPALDPDIGYMYRVPVSEAEDGFHISGQYFKLNYARKGSLKITRA